MVCEIQKAGMWKRFSAYLLDVILLGIAAVGFAFLLSFLLGYNTRTEELERLQSEYEVNHGVDFDITGEAYDALTEEERAAFDAEYAAFAGMPEVSRLNMLIISLILTITAFGILIAYLIFELLVPMKLGNGQTIGKKIFGIAVMRVDSVRLSAFQLSVRTVLGKYTVETMIPVLLVLLFFFGVMPLMCAMGILFLLILQIVFLVTTRLRTPIHDLMAGTVTVEMSSQMIFDTAEDLQAYQKRVHEEEVQRAAY